MFYERARQIVYYTVSDLDVELERSGRQEVEGWEILPRCRELGCGQAAEFVIATGPADYHSAHYCYEHGKDLPGAIPCICKPTQAREWM